MEKLKWFVSSYSSGNGQCAACAKLPNGGMAIKDDKDPNSPILRFTADEWQAFLVTLR